VPVWEIHIVLDRRGLDGCRPLSASSTMARSHFVRKHHAIYVSVIAKESSNVVSTIKSSLKSLDSATKSGVHFEVERQLKFGFCRNPNFETLLSLKQSPRHSLSLGKVCSPIGVQVEVSVLTLPFQRHTGSPRWTAGRHQPRIVSIETIQRIARVRAHHLSADLIRERGFMHAVSGFLLK
jgi:hypothetical protein